jgi:hypothetical protein
MIVNNVRSIHGFPKSADKRGDSETRYVRAVILVMLLVTLAQAQQRWTRTYGGLWNDYGRSGLQTADSGYVVAGYSESYGAGYNDFYLIKTNASGDLVWSQTYGDTGYQGAYSVRQTADRGFVMTGVTMPPSGTSFDVRIVKTNASGDPVWTKTYGGAADDQGFDIRQTADGGYIITGVTRSFGVGTNDILLLRTTEAGDSLWFRSCGGNGSDIGYSILETSDHGYIIAGMTSGIGGFNEDVYLVKISASGDTIWSRTFGGDGDDEGSCVSPTTDGGYIITGLTHPAGPGDFDVYLIKTDSSGETLWTRTFGGDNYDAGRSVQQTSDGGYIVAGTSYVGVGDADVYLIKTNASGDTQWTRTFGGSGTDGASSVQQTFDGGYIVAGYTSSFGAGSYDVWLIKTDANGSAAVEEPGGSRQKAADRMSATPNPFASFARVPGHETEQFELYDASGKKLGTFPGNRIGEGLPSGVYFVRLVGEHARSLRVVKVLSGQ